MKDKTHRDTRTDLSKTLESPACIRDIFLHDKEKHTQELIKLFKQSKVRPDTNCKEYISINPNYTDIRPIFKPIGSAPKNGGGTKKKITEFSKKARRSFIKSLCKLEEPIELWQDFTFADDIMAGKSIEQRRDTSNKILNRFRRILKRKYPDLWAVYKREWQPRKSGNLSGEYVPHYHMFIAVRNRPDKYDYKCLAIDLAQIWVHCTQTTEYGKALHVAQHINSSRLIANQQHAMKYASKYLGKTDGFKTEESIGRSSGTLGKIKKGSPRIVELTPDEAVIVRREFRKKAKKHKGLQKYLKRPETSTFLIIRKETVDRILKYVGDTLEWKCHSFFAEVS